MGERLDRTQEVSGSNPLSSTFIMRVSVGRDSDPTALALKTSASARTSSAIC